jgi:peptidoglycan/xylan/chitin deacetylase (PgdA/CDA1 family)
MSDRLLVLGWHNVTGTYGFPSRPGAAQRGFAQQMKILARTAKVLPLQQALASLHAGERLPARAVALSFDDGYRDNLTIAAPILERLKLPATFFLVPRLLSGEVDAWWETIGWAIECSSRSALQWEDVQVTLGDRGSRQTAYSQLVRRLKRRDQAAREQSMAELIERLQPTGQAPDLFMDWDGAHELVARGFDIQAHTCSHPVLALESRERQRRELSDSRQELEAKLGVAVSTIAYPHGGPQDYSAETLAAAEQAGYRWGVTTREGFANGSMTPLEVRRCVVYPERGVVDLLAQLRYLMQARLKGQQS